jgi:Lrp/AsnC family leucine-responsive transcriptional regulator
MAALVPCALRERKQKPANGDVISAMDAVDSEILRLLRENGRISWRDLGAAVGLSANAAADRVRRLRQAGVIFGFAALVDPAAGGRRLEALVGVALAHGTDSDRFAVEAGRLAPVTEVLHLAGAPDYMLRVSCHDTAELDILLRTLRLELGASDTETKIVLRSGRPDPTGQLGVSTP